jgi:hypothetical protein
MENYLYSDPYLKALLEEEPKLAKEFLEAIASTNFVKESEVISCVEVPGWVLEKAGVDACANPNFPQKQLERYLKDDELLSNHFWKVFSYPHLDKAHIKKLSKSKDVNVRGLALVHPLGDSSELLKYIDQMVTDKTQPSSVLSYICSNVDLSDTMFSYLFGIHDFDSGFQTIGQALWSNPTLSNEQKTALVLADIKPTDDSATEYWGRNSRCFISSIPYFQQYRVSFYWSGEIERFKEIPLINQKVTSFFSKKGHHLSLLQPNEIQTETGVNLLGLQDLTSLQLLHRLFWTDLCKRNDFEIYRRNAYRTDDLFIAHPILGREFEDADVEEATRLGGVFIFSNQDWLQGAEELSSERAAHELRAYEQSLVPIVEDGDYDHLGQTLIALTFEMADFAEKYGFELTDSAEDWMIEAALEFAESDSFDVSADLNPHFGEMLSWQTLPDSKKEVIFEFLKLGYQEKHSKLRSDSVHFLGCMALHEDTPKSLLKKLAELGDPLIDEVLASR